MTFLSSEFFLALLVVTVRGPLVSGWSPIQRSHDPATLLAANHLFLERVLQGFVICTSTSSIEFLDLIYIYCDHCLLSLHSDYVYIIPSSSIESSASRHCFWNLAGIAKPPSHFYHYGCQILAYTSRSSGLDLLEN
ncbi:hypothetical protein QBC44DRAFT_7605 [Cladorrhinum sp. PSN332]|nr:hypothetical protein QBC44DRAFT_7605 [Cladorrhinum sp. PSN332]